MDNTIEKALQRQRAKKQAELNQKDAVSSLEKAVTVQNKDAVSEDATHNTEVKKTNVKKTSSQPFPNADKQSGQAIPDERNGSLTIDVEALEGKGFVSLNSKRSRINEEFREIKRKLLKNAFGFLSTTLKRSNIIMVSSARPSEGKTFTAINLALSIAAEQDKTVLLVDADVLKPNVMRTLDISANEGLMDYLIDDTRELSSVLYNTNVDKLKIIPAGSSHHLSTELLASKRMEDTIEEFSTRYADRVVIIDTPPMLGINESAVLAGFAGQAVMVVEEGKAKLNDISAAVERLNPDMAVGFVVNKALNNNYDKAGYYGYYYGSSK